MTERISKIAGALAEFDTPASLIEAAKKMHEAGYVRFDCHSPFPIHGMDKAMGLKRSPLGFIVGGAAILGFSGIVWLMWWASTVAYPMVISGKPLFSYQAFMPVAFAITVLSSALAALFGMFVLNRLPQLFHPFFESEIFCKVSNDRFVLSVPSNDPKFDVNETKTLLQSIGGRNAEIVELP